LKQPVVAVYRPVDGAENSYEALRAAGCRVIIEPVDKPGAQISDDVRAADVLMGATFRGGVMDESWLRQFPQLRLIAKYTIGFDDVDMAAATARGIAVTHCPTEANWGGVAEGAFAMMLTVLKRLRERDTAVKGGGWRNPALEGCYLGARSSDGYAGLVVGIVGLGRAGTRFAELLRPWKVSLLACDPYVAATHFATAGAGSVALEELLERAAVVSLHCALTSQTRGMIGAQAIARMQPGSLLINTARGAVVDLDALLDGLEKDRPGYAALDVFPREPLNDVARLAALGNRVLLSPHMVAANRGGTLLAAVPWATQAVLDALRGQVPERLVDNEVEAAWLERFGNAQLIDVEPAAESQSSSHS
jgi:D-3-phosphoglycerate dehydrogenase / 2-oxoglutarate reductase